MVELQEYWQAVHTKICPNCGESDGHGNCLLEPAIECALQKSLPVLIDIVTHTDMWGRENQEEMRAIICGKCKYQTISGSCRLRDEVQCVVARRFSSILDALQSVVDLRRNKIQ